MTLTGAECRDGLVYALQGNWLLPGDTQGRTVACPPRLCLDDSACAPLHTGPLCGQCANGTTEWSGRCVACDSSSGRGGMLVLVLLVGFLYVGFIVKTASARSATAGHLGIFLYTTQTAVQMLGDSGAGSNTVVGVLNFDLDSLIDGHACVFETTPAGKLAWTLAVPYLIAAQLVVVAATHAALGLVVRARGGHKLIKRTYARAGIALVMATFTHSIGWCLRYMQCVDTGSERVLYEMPGVRCGSTAYWALLLLVIPSLALFLVAFPYVAVRYGGVCVKNKETRDKAGTVWGVLTEPYKLRFPYWELYVMGRRACLLAIDTLAASVPGVRAGLFTLLHLVCLLVQCIAWPYETHVLNQLEIIAQACLVLMALLLTTTPDVPRPKATTGLYIFLLLIPVCVIVGAVVKDRWQQRQQRRREAVEATTKEMSSQI